MSVASLNSLPEQSVESKSLTADFERAVKPRYLRPTDEGADVPGFNNIENHNADN